MVRLRFLNPDFHFKWHIVKFPSIFLCLSSSGIAFSAHRTHKEIISKISSLILIARPHLFAFLHSIAHKMCWSVALNLRNFLFKSIHLLDVNKKTRHFAHHYATNKKPYHRHNRYNFFHSISIVLFFLASPLSFLCYQTAFPCFHCHIQFAILFLQFYVCPAAWKRKQQHHLEKKMKNEKNI